MKKTYCLIALMGFSLWSFTQIQQTKVEEKLSPDLQQSTFESKSTGDVIWSEDFSSGLPEDWTLIDSVGMGGWQFIAEDTAYTGFITDAVEAMINTEGLGYMHLPVDYYNCTPNVWPRESAGTERINAVMETSWIDLQGSFSGYSLSFATWFKLCCTEDAKLDIRIATIDAPDTWTVLDGTDIGGFWVPLFESPIGDNVAYPKYNITEIVGASTQIKIQFHMHGAYFHFWSIDDVMISEPLANDIAVLRSYAQSNINNPIQTTSDEEFMDYETSYSEVPTGFINNMQFGALIRQNGLNAVNARVDFSIDSSGVQSVWSSSSTTSIPNYGNEMFQDSVLVSDILDGTGINPYTFDHDNLDLNFFQANNYLENGLPYQINYTADSDNIDEDLTNNTQSYNFTQTFGRYSYHSQPSRNPVCDYYSYSEFQSTQEVSHDWFANAFNMYPVNNEAFKIHGFRILLSLKEGASFDVLPLLYKPVLFKWDPLYSSWGGNWVEIEVLSPGDQELLEEDLGGFVYLKFDEAEVENYNFEEGKYAVGIEINNNDEYEFAFGIDTSSNERKSQFLMYISPFDYWMTRGVNGSVMIDLYTEMEQLEYDRNVSLGVDPIFTSNMEKVQVYPNPSSGIVNIKNAEQASIYIYSITGILIRLIKNESTELSVNLSDLSNGNYLVKIVKENEVITKKFILNR